jgi:heat shock protein HslJ
MATGRWIGAFIAIFGVALANTPAAAQIDRDLAGSRWALVEVYGEALPQDASPHLAFQERGQLSGRTACNWFHGSYSTEGSGIVILTNLTTLRGCEVDNKLRPDPTLEALDSSMQFAIAGSVLTLSNNAGEAIAKLERRSAE